MGPSRKKEGEENDGVVKIEGEDQILIWTKRVQIILIWTPSFFSILYLNLIRKLEETTKKPKRLKHIYKFMSLISS